MFSKLFSVFRKSPRSIAPQVPPVILDEVVGELKSNTGVGRSRQPQFSKLSIRAWGYSEIQGDDKSRLEDFINKHVPPPEGYTLFDAHGNRGGIKRPDSFLVIRAQDSFGRISGAVAFQIQPMVRVLALSEYNIEINYIAVADEFRSEGLAGFLIAQAILLSIEKMEGENPKSVNGICKAEQVGFYEKQGFDVTKSNETLPVWVLPNNHQNKVDIVYPYSFWKMWSEIGDLNFVLSPDPRLFSSRKD